MMSTQNFISNENSFKDKDKNKDILDKLKSRESITSELVMNEMLKEVLQAEGHMNLFKRMKSIRDGKYVGKYKRLFSCF